MTFEKVLEARREEEERRRNKYAKMEAEREKVRQGIRDKVGLTQYIWSSTWIKKFLFKYNIKKQEEQVCNLPDLDNSLNRQKKTPAQLQINTDDGLYIWYLNFSHTVE